MQDRFRTPSMRNKLAFAIEETIAGRAASFALAPVVVVVADSAPNGGYCVQWALKSAKSVVKCNNK
ncbi:hypothetical protein PRIPAC_83587 [Pristionchus pacificus]|uniref:Uncharacterized protein n=1 Tax=Pristionchus pacificus TaxID=54126 RepID=A0A2A6BUX3_PRIPA|nr:hypothetical protein PRIPAC_83587 [Pristionchus pacificus]|eukprot:PDM69603.1 hypothetical protein PRIPAC_44699 [Pristionchus pacificus]